MQQTCIMYLLCSSAYSIVPLNFTYNYKHKFNNYIIKKFNTVTTLNQAQGPFEWWTLSDIAGHKLMKLALWKYKKSFPEATIKTMAINTRLLRKGGAFEVAKITRGIHNVRKYSIKLTLTRSSPTPTQLHP